MTVTFMMTLRFLGPGETKVRWGVHYRPFHTTLITELCTALQGLTQHSLQYFIKVHIYTLIQDSIQNATTLHKVAELYAPLHENSAVHISRLHWIREVTMQAMACARGQLNTCMINLPLWSVLIALSIPHPCHWVWCTACMQWCTFMVCAQVQVGPDPGWIGSMYDCMILVLCNVFCASNSVHWLL